MDNDFIFWLKIYYANSRYESNEYRGFVDMIIKLWDVLRIRYKNYETSAIGQRLKMST
jgi:hypothetical protein